MPLGDEKKLFNDKERESFLKDLLEKTDGYSGADIESLAREAALLSLRESIDRSAGLEWHPAEPGLK